MAIELTPLPIPPDRNNNFWYAYNDSDTVIVFVHGIFSNSRSCWLHTEPGPPVFWPDLIRIDPRFEAPSIYLSGYYTAIDAGDFPIDQCAREVLEALQRPDVSGAAPALEKRNLVFVCHSTGGIVVRYLLCRYLSAFRDKAVGVALIASPSRGSVWANVASIAATYYNQSLGRQLEWRGEAIEEIHSRFKDLVVARDLDVALLFGMEACETQMVFRKSVPATIRWLLPNRLKVVTTESAGQYFGQVKYLAGTDHFSSVKPDSLTHPSHEFLETFVRRFRALQPTPAPLTPLPARGAAAPTAGEPDQRRQSPGAPFDADYFAAQQQIVDEHAKRFVGRVQVEESFRTFMSRHSRGYFFLTGGPGLGKTAFACHLAKKFGLMCHLTKRSSARGDPRLILCSLLHQIAARSNTSVDLDGDLPTLVSTFRESLRVLAKHARPVTILVDGLDELRADVGSDLPFLPYTALPEGTYFVITSRPHERLTRLQSDLAELPSRTYELGPMDRAEVQELLHDQGLDFQASDIARIASTSQGSPLYLRALAEELAADPHFDLSELPPAVEDYFRRAIGRLPERGAVTDVVSLLAAAREPLSERDLADITGIDRDQIHENGVQPILPFLLEFRGAYSFYHESFATFVRSELIDGPALRAAHSAIADWLRRPDRKTTPYAWRWLAFHLFASSRGDDLTSAINEEFLREKVRRFGFAVLDDVELLTRWLIETGDSSLLERSVNIVERLRTVAGGDLMADVERSVRFSQVAPGLERPIVSSVTSTADADVYIGMIPKIGASADFAEVVDGGSRLWLTIGDVPASGLKSAFAARFVANLFRRLAAAAPEGSVAHLLDEIRRTIQPAAYFDRISMQCVEIDAAAGRLRLANAGHPAPVLYSAKRRASDRLTVMGPLFDRENVTTAYRARSAEISEGDVLVLVSDGLTEGGRLQEPYGYRFTSILEQLASASAQAIGERILDDWRAHPRSPEWIDDVTVVVAVLRSAEPD